MRTVLKVQACIEELQAEVAKQQLALQEVEAKQAEVKLVVTKASVDFEAAAVIEAVAHPPAASSVAGRKDFAYLFSTIYSQVRRAQASFYMGLAEAHEEHGEKSFKHKHDWGVLDKTRKVVEREVSGILTRYFRAGQIYSG